MSGLFAILKDNSIKRVVIDKVTSTSLDSIYEALERDFFFNKDGEKIQVIPFDIQWNPKDQDSLFKIDDYDDDLGLSKSSENSATLPIFESQSDSQYLKSIFYKMDNGNIYIQYIDGRNLLNPSKKILWLFGADNCFSFGDQNFLGIFIPSKLHAVIKDNTLYFSSFIFANRVLNLEQYVAEANESQLLAFATNGKIILEDENANDFSKNSKTNVKRYVGLILASQVLEDFSANELKKKADRASIPLEIKDQKIVIPSETKTRTQVFKFLTNMIVPSYIYEDGVFETNSIRRISTKEK